MEGEVLEVGEVADSGGDLAGEVGLEEEEGDDAVGLVVTLEAVPVAAVDVRVPGGEEVGVVEGGLYAEEDLLVLWVAEDGGGRAEEEGGEEGQEEEEEAGRRHC